jgi:MSHA biogenesis protein MshE
VWLNRYTNNQAIQTEGKSGKGCVQCNNTGYRGRAAIFEILIPDKAMLETIRKKEYGRFAKLAHESETFTPLSTSAINLAKQGITSIEEILRVCESIEDISEHS